MWPVLVTRCACSSVLQMSSSAPRGSDNERAHCVCLMRPPPKNELACGRIFIVIKVIFENNN